MCSSSSSFYRLPLTQTRITLKTRPKPATIRASVSASVSSRPGPTLYEVLGISKDVSLGEIKKAYKEMALRYHPDVSPPGRAEEYTERFIRVQEAYETLSDPDSRALYDGDSGKGLHLAFSARRRRGEDDSEMEYKSEWKNRWQGQLAELKIRSANKNSRESASWGAKIRRQMDDSSEEV